MPSSRTVTLIHAVPIPVGHKVEVTYYVAVSESLSIFGATKTSKKQLGSPRVRDLDTGIVYGHWLHHSDGGAIFNGKINVPSLDLRSDAKVSERFKGTVKACQVTAVSFGKTGHDFVHLETHLVVEVA